MKGTAVREHSPERPEQTRSLCASRTLPRKSGPQAGRGVCEIIQKGFICFTEKALDHTLCYTGPAKFFLPGEASSVNNPRVGCIWLRRASHFDISHVDGLHLDMQGWATVKERRKGETRKGFMSEPCCTGASPLSTPRTPEQASRVRLNLLSLALSRSSVVFDPNGV